MNSNGSTPDGSLRSISTSPPASKVHSREGSTYGTVVVAAEESGASGRAVVSGACVATGSEDDTEAVSMTDASAVPAEATWPVDEGPSSEESAEPSAKHPPATTASPRSTPSSGNHPRNEYPTDFTGPLSTIGRSGPRISGLWLVARWADDESTEDGTTIWERFGLRDGPLTPRTHHPAVGGGRRRPVRGRQQPLPPRRWHVAYPSVRIRPVGERSSYGSTGVLRGARRRRRSHAARRSAISASLPCLVGR